MNDPHLHPTPPPSRFDRRPLLVVGLAATVVCVLIAMVSRGDDGTSVVSAAPAATDAPVTLAPVTVAPVTVAPVSSELPDPTARS